MLFEFNGKKPKTGKGTFVSDTATVIGDVKIGDNCYIGHNAVLRGDYGSIEIGDNTAIEECSVVHTSPNEKCRIGKNVMISHGVMLHSKYIGSNSTIGIGSVLSLGSQVGQNSIVAEGCVVKMDQTVPEGLVVTGNPAKITRKVEQNDIDKIKLGREYYLNLTKQMVEGGLKEIK